MEALRTEGGSPQGTTPRYPARAGRPDARTRGKGMAECLVRNTSERR